MLSLIVATDENNLIGNNNQLPWHLPADLTHFKKLTEGNIVVMGRKTYESLPEKFRPLPNRENIVLSRQKHFKIPHCKVFNNIEDFLKYQNKEKKEMFIIGGMSIYKQFIDSIKIGGEMFSDSIKLLDKIYLTTIHHKFSGDAYFPKIDKNEWIETESIYNKADEKNIYPYTFSTLERIL